MNTDMVDRIKIRETIDRYCDAINRQDWYNFGSFWTDDAFWEAQAPINMEARGLEQILKITRAGRERTEFLVHMNHAIVIDYLEGDVARSHHTLHIKAFGQSGFGYSCIGIYDDELRRFGDGWQFSRRSYRPSWYDDSRPAGCLIEGTCDPVSMPRVA